MSKLNIDCVIGIDCGKNGAISMWTQDKIIKVIKMPKDLIDIKSWLDYIKTIAKPLIIIEKVQFRPDDLQGGKAYRIQSMLADFERLKTIIDISGVPYILVHPITWQSTLKLRIKGEDKTRRKNRYKEIATNLYPTIKATLWSADAILIMHFGRHQLANNINWIINSLPLKYQGVIFE